MRVVLSRGVESGASHVVSNRAAVIGGIFRIVISTSSHAHLGKTSLQAQLSGMCVASLSPTVTSKSTLKSGIASKARSALTIERWIEGQT